MHTRTRASLFLMEQLFAICVFAVCAAVCAFIFTEAAATSQAARDINHATIAAKNAAEAYKASGDLVAVAALLGGRALDPTEAVIYYDQDWRPCPEDVAIYSLRLNPTTLTISKMGSGEIIAFPVVVRESGE